MDFRMKIGVTAVRCALAVAGISANAYAQEAQVDANTKLVQAETVNDKAKTEVDLKVSQAQEKVAQAQAKAAQAEADAKAAQAQAKAAQIQAKIALAEAKAAAAQAEVDAAQAEVNAALAEGTTEVKAPQAEASAASAQVQSDAKAPATEAESRPASAEAGSKVARVTITGSNIKSVDAETASPVQVVTRKDINRQGLTNISDLISNISASTGGLSDIGGDGTFAPGASNVSLRGLGTQSTLVLVNGRRIASYGFANFTEVFSNVDTIPIDAVERVEILKSGASAIYGSDAVAGVINIITRTNYQGVEVSADSTNSLQSHTFGTNKASITAGFGDLNTDGYNILVNADFFKRNNVMWTNLLQYTNPALIAKSPGFGTYSSYSYPGNFNLDGTNFQPVDGCDQNLIIGGLCKYNRYERFQAVPESDRSNFFSSGTYNLTGNTQAFAEVSISKSKTSYISTFPVYRDSGAIQWVNPKTNLTQTFNYLGLPINDPFNQTGADGVGFRYRFWDAPTSHTVDGTQYRVLGGLRGSFDKYEWESGVGFMGSKATESQQGYAFSSSGFIREIGDYTSYTGDISGPLNYQANDPNFFAQPNGYHPGKPNSRAVLNDLFPVYGNVGKTEAQFVDSKISGPLYILPAGAVNFALGGEVRRETMQIAPSDNLLSGDIVGYGISAADSSRVIESAYTELSIPVLKSLEMQTALRADKYPNIGVHLSPKLALRYTPTDSLLLRATYENGFRAPNLVESANSTKSAYDSGTVDPLRCSQATALSKDLFAQANNAAPQAQAALVARAESVQAAECGFGLSDIVKNNPNLKPETSKSFSFGAVWEPVKGYSASADYWHIARHDTIGLTSTAQLLNGGPLPAGTTLNRAPLYNPGLPTVDPVTGKPLPNQPDPTFSVAELAQYGVLNGPLQNVIRQMENISEQSTSGIDIAFKAVENFDSVGRLSAIVDGTYNLTFYDTSASTSTDNLVGQYGSPHLVSSITLILDKNGYSNSLRFNYTSGYALQYGQSDTSWSTLGCSKNSPPLTATECQVGAAKTVDYAFEYTGYKNLVLDINVFNLLQQRSPVDFRAFAGGSYVTPISTQDAAGRTLRIGLNYKFK